jgi:hypothetical protein
MQVRPIGNRIAYIDPNAKADGAVRWLVAIILRNLMLDTRSAADCSINAVERRQQGIAGSLDDAAAMLLIAGSIRFARRAFSRWMAPTSSAAISRLYPTMSA